MQREILFRGKGLGNRGWIYGFYYNVYEKSKGKLHLNHYIIREQVAGKESSVFAVNGDTLGQYTGLTDKNGVKIFEGDILHMPGYHCKVVFDVCGFVSVYEHYEDPETLWLCDLGVETMEVIGNIHDNEK